MKKKRILLIDDEVDFVELLSLRLQTHNYEVSAAYQGKEGLEKAEDNPDLILLDVMLPDMLGYKVCYNLRQNKKTSRIPIIMLTAKDAPREKIEGLYIGADDYITKPFDTEELFARIEAVFRRTLYFEEKVKDKAQSMNEIKRIIQNELMMPVFQPIFSLRPHKVLGVEVLSRPPANSYFNNPEILFDTAFHLGIHFDLEMACHKKALVKLGDHAKENLVFFNVSPYLVQDAKFRDFSAFYRLYTEPKMITLELTERTAIGNFSAFYQSLKSFKNDGFKISIDDIGSGYASLNSIVEIRPDFIKIDMHLIRNIAVDPVRQNLLKAMVTFCKESNIFSIAEGVENQEELEVLMDFGVDAAQGYLLGRPSLEIQS